MHTYIVLLLVILKLHGLLNLDDSDYIRYNLSKANICNGYRLENCI